MSQSLSRPREIITFCLRPLELAETDAKYLEVSRRLEHVIRTLQSEALKANRPVAVDFSKMATITINEDAHGND